MIIKKIQKCVKKLFVLDKLDIKLEKKENNREYVVFDAIHDNDGKGINAKDLVNVLKK